ncbi:hypothetical protein GMLC_36120 [Geomonas limicola]|uniref:Uncharacterized protein n=1 Tax=Geomonas limicola TaxID=2740186 RepID=A0A6V8NEN4_9BACT|nr:hypothetical protein [Geomonas limicola]GFO70033.1 hypothetical protein GMLC_36120 [Geomonas limicola]
MFKAVVKGKAGRIQLENGSSLSWRDLFRKREDLLTATFFGRLRYLSQAGEQKVLALLLDQDAATRAGAIKHIEFWPKFSKEDQGYVEPDVLMICENACVLVEVKPPFGGDQHIGQWKHEITQATKEWAADGLFTGDDQWQLHFLALGRNVPEWKVNARSLEEKFSQWKLRVHTQEWLPLRDCIAKICEQEAGRDRFIYQDWLEALQLFGVSKRLLPFSEMEMMDKVTMDVKHLFMGWEPL